MKPIPTQAISRSFHSFLYFLLPIIYGFILQLLILVSPVCFLFSFSLFVFLVSLFSKSLFQLLKLGYNKLVSQLYLGQYLQLNQNLISFYLYIIYVNVCVCTHFLPFTFCSYCFRSFIINDAASPFNGSDGFG